MPEVPAADRLRNAIEELKTARFQENPDTAITQQVQEWQGLVLVHTALHMANAGMSAEPCSGADLGEPQPVDSDWQPCRMATMERTAELNLVGHLRYITDQGLDLHIQARTTSGEQR